ncbi:hypothetical protein Tco_0936855 [Tanacetum coccineum]|uniref:Aspartic peptidase DDI1-type domain-containing protein n=1 Tax=Tanacetum coccineum TaxID=301880 RepID=A0ABQ5DCK4_9ASTR
MTPEEAARERLKKTDQFDEICLDKNKLDEAIKDEQKEAIKRAKGEALIEKEDPDAFIFPIRLEGKINLNGVADTGSEVNVMPYRIYIDLGCEKEKKVNRGIEMINHSLAEPMGLLKDVLCQVGVTTIIAKFLILDIPIDRDQKLAIRTSINTEKSDSDDEQEYAVKREKFGALTYGPMSAKYLNITEPKDRSLALQAALNPFHQIFVWKKVVSFLGSLPVPLQHVNCKPEYNGYPKNEEEGTGQWKAEIRLTDPYGNIYNQGGEVAVEGDEGEEGDGDNDGGFWCCMSAAAVMAVVVAMMTRWWLSRVLVDQWWGVTGRWWRSAAVMMVAVARLWWWCASGDGAAMMLVLSEEPNVILGRSFIRLAKDIMDFGNGIITIHPDFDLFFDDSDTVRDNEENRELMFDLDDIHEIEETELPPLICKMGKSSRNKKRVLEGFQIYYQNEGPSRSKGEPITQEEAARERLAISIYERYAILEQNRPVIETLAYSDKYRKLLDEICLDKRKLEGKINLNGVADTGFEVDVMPYRINMDLGREKVKKVNRVGVTTIIAKFLILDIPIDRDAQIMVGRGFLSTCGGILDTIDRVISTYDGVCHQTFRAARIRINIAESYSDDEEEYAVKRDKFGALTYGPKSAKYLNITEPKDRSLAFDSA